MAWRESLSQLVGLEADSFCNGNGIVARICGLQARTDPPLQYTLTHTRTQHHRRECMPRGEGNTYINSMRQPAFQWALG